MATASRLKLPKRTFAVPQPVHTRLSDLCRTAIVKGDIKPGERFPSERELAERYRVSRATANKVIASLVAEGLLELRKGIGARVRQSKNLFASLDGMESFTTHAEKQGMVPTTEVLRFKRVRASDLKRSVREGLCLAIRSREPVVYLERLRFADGIPMIFESRWVREKLAKGLSRDDVAESFYRVLEEKFDLRMTGERHTISAVLLDKVATRRFQLKSPIAALRVRGSGFVRGDEPLWYQELLYRGDRYELDNQTIGPASAAIELRLNSAR